MSCFVHNANISLLEQRRRENSKYIFNVLWLKLLKSKDFLNCSVLYQWEFKSVLLVRQYEKCEDTLGSQKDVTAIFHYFLTILYASPWNNDEINQ